MYIFILSNTNCFVLGFLINKVITYPLYLGWLYPTCKSIHMLASKTLIISHAYFIIVLLLMGHLSPFKKNFCPWLMKFKSCWCIVVSLASRCLLDHCLIDEITLGQGLHNSASLDTYRISLPFSKFQYIADCFITHLPPVPH